MMDPIILAGLSSAGTLILRELGGLIGAALTKYRQGRIEDNATILEDHRRTIKDQRAEINDWKKEASDVRGDLETTQGQLSVKDVKIARTEAQIEYLQDLLREKQIRFREYNARPPSGVHAPLAMPAPDPLPRKEPPP